MYIDIFGTDFSIVLFGVARKGAFVIFLIFGIFHAGGFTTP